MALDHSYETDHVWQMQERTSSDKTSVLFSVVRLPRPMHVEYARGPDYLIDDWQAGGCFLVAEEGGEIRGYLSVSAQRWHQIGWINNLVVDRPFRKKGIGTSLMKRGIAWGRSLGLDALMLDVQTKNHPAIRFCQKFGFKFCGFNDQYYANRDIALFFALSLAQKKLQFDWEV